MEMKRIEEIYESTVVEKDEHRKSQQYKRLSPKMKDAVDDLFKKMDAKPSDFLNSFERNIKFLRGNFLGILKKKC